MLNKRHHCPDWDFDLIRPGDPEMECCTCTPDEEASRWDALNNDEKDKERE